MNNDSDNPTASHAGSEQTVGPGVSGTGPSPPAQGPGTSQAVAAGGGGPPNSSQVPRLDPQSLSKSIRPARASTARPWPAEGPLLPPLKPRAASGYLPWRSSTHCPAGP